MEATVYRRKQRLRVWSDAIPLIVCIMVMAIVLPVIIRQGYLQATVRPIQSSDLVVGNTLYHMVGRNKSRHLREARIVRIEGEQVVTEEWGWFGTKTLYNSRRDLLDGHKVHILSLDREWSAR